MKFKTLHQFINRRVAINWRAAVAALILLLSWSATPVALLAQQPDVCAMECCVAEGHCCCAARKPFVEGQDHSGVREIGPVEVTGSCPCPATQPAGVKLFTRQTPRTEPRDLAADHVPPAIHRGPESFYRSLRFRPKSPRAPPSFSLTA